MTRRSSTARRPRRRDQGRARRARRRAARSARASRPGLGTVLVGDDPGSHAYVGGKHADCARSGSPRSASDLPATATQARRRGGRRRLNADPTCTGYIVQLPLPKGLDSPTGCSSCIDPAKDADGLHPTNLGRLVLNVNAPMSVAAAVHPARHRRAPRALRRPAASAAEVCGRRPRRHGRPPARAAPHPALEINATVTLCHTGTKDVAEHVRRADVVVAAAAGVPGDHHRRRWSSPVRPSSTWASPASSTTRPARPGSSATSTPDVREVAAWVAPMPGGVGPMTRAMLISNVVEAAERATA